ncbi:MAG: hypothetical protein VXX11_03305 [Planctomycetota bacterium]|nr:hypothetical protein [Planctomycetota bacterium]
MAKKGKEKPINWNPEELDEEQVRKWLAQSSVNQINVFIDYNRVIKTLCKALLIAWGKKPWNKQ